MKPKRNKCRLHIHLSNSEVNWTELHHSSAAAAAAVVAVAAVVAAVAVGD